MTDPLSADIRAASRGGIAFGVVVIILGLLAIGSPLVSGIAMATLAGIFLLLAGLIQLVFAFTAPSLRQGSLILLFGGFAVLAGATILARPLLGLKTITLVLMIYFLMDGWATIMSGWRLRPEPGSGWMIFGGATSVLLGVLLLAKWPLSGLWAVGVLVGVRLVMRGSSMIALSMVGRRLAENLEEDAG